MSEWWSVILFITVIALAFAVIAMFFINYDPLTEGEVIDKYYEPAHEVYSPINITIDGKNQTIQNWRQVGDKWRLIVQNGDKKDIWFVSESFYNSVKVGDWVKK